MPYTQNDKPIKVSLSWSGGKDSAFALWKLLRDKRYEVVSLHTTFNDETKRVGLHGTSEDLIEEQAKSIGIPLEKIFFSSSASNDAYENAMRAFYDKIKSEGVHHVAYGDIMLQDLRDYREEQLSKESIKGIFPLWRRSTDRIIQDFLYQGFKTIICAADGEKVELEWVGRTLDKSFLTSLPSFVDPCGENGEYHSFCYEGPIFNNPLATKVTSVVPKSYSVKLESGKVEKRWVWFAEMELES
ncbi:adenine nucleotide alpha hydrolase [Litoribacter ruber]|uniref:Adenine nucleotide alpha hydrolase n=1 Tax=Litoribacter ruber TaxID=702568 RepID=A0AAP2CJK1_9BACT|nr:MULTISPECIES: adenine nucleotide alpha hydrolase [Litoribacter]MBS9524919.1 adenine nucleotide alpha hydrolase [Litoribacter alkaliphilus]MBT0811920.1 adenine nucleotide alpha hydrolase [Litoribacter ruber]